MSSTSDYSELRKSVLNKDLFFLRVSSLRSASAKKRPPLPKNILPLAPLDFNEIKREIKEAADNEDPSFISESDSTMKEDDKKTEESDKFDISSQMDNSLELVSCPKNTKESRFSSQVEPKPEDVVDAEVHLSDNCKENVEPTKIIVPKKTKDNDSFDLDFSALSLYTPIKKAVSSKEELLDTAKKRITPFNNFATPNVKYVLPTKIHCSVPRNRSYTPINSTINSTANKVQTLQNNVITTIARNIPDDKTFHRLYVNQREYLVLSLLGKGGSSHVYQCFCMEKRILVAIKCVSLENAASAEGYLNEVKLLQKLQSCDRIIKLYDYEILDSEKRLLMVLENGGKDFTTILKSLDSQKMNIPLYMLVFYWIEMLQAVKQIHAHGVIHADLKPSNFLKGDEGLKLIDFGIASTVQNDMTSVYKSVPEGSCNYMSPEALNNDTTSPGISKYKIHYKSDVWSLGCILYQLVYKRTPFHHLKQLWAKLAYIIDPNHKIEYPDANWVPPKVIDTIKKCLQHNVRLRPSVAELLEEYDKNLCNTSRV